MSARKLSLVRSKKRPAAHEKREKRRKTTSFISNGNESTVDEMSEKSVILEESGVLSKRAGDSQLGSARRARMLTDDKKHAGLVTKSKTITMAMLSRPRVLAFSTKVERRSLSRVCRSVARRTITWSRSNGRFCQFGRLYLESHPKKPFKCRQCWMMKEFCCCDEILRNGTVDVAHDIVLFIDIREHQQERSSNSAKLIPLLFNCPVYTHGVAESETALFFDLMKERPENVLILFPSRSSVSVDTFLGEERSGMIEPTEDDGVEREQETHQRRLKIIILDGTWHRVKTMNKFSLLDGYRRVHLTGSSRKKHGNMRKMANDAKVSTMSAVIHLFEELHVDPSTISAMERAHAIAVEAFRRQTNQRIVSADSKAYYKFQKKQRN